jgi:hypothetical protein
MIKSFFTETPEVLRKKNNAGDNKAVQMSDYVKRNKKENTAIDW